MKTILSTIVAAGLFAGAAHATFDPFNDSRQALPRSTGYERALPHTSNDDFRDALPLVEEAFPDVVVAKP
jgi:hypothetical protein